jgi:GNAT superfamily N-acetyltransferase
MSSSTSSLPGQETLLASWAALAQTSPGAGVIRCAATAAAVFPAWVVLNNAILLDAGDGADVAARLDGVYSDAGVGVWALWRPSRITDLDARDEVSELGPLTRDTTTLVMRRTIPRGLRLHDGVVRTSVAAASDAGDDPIPGAGLDQPDDVPGLAGWAMIVDGTAVAGAWTFLHEDDCGVYAVGTAPGWRRRGLARSLMEHVLADAQQHGARTATLQSTRMGKPLYESLGFEAVGRYEEWVFRADDQRSSTMSASG